MRHCIIAAILTVVGLFSIGAGIHHLRGCPSDRQTFERHVADICVQAAERAREKSSTSNATP